MAKYQHPTLVPMNSSTTLQLYTITATVGDVSVVLSRKLVMTSWPNKKRDLDKIWGLL